MLMLKLVCPECDKLLGMTKAAHTSDLLRLWCRRCKSEVIPIPAKQAGEKNER